MVHIVDCDDHRYEILWDNVRDIEDVKRIPASLGVRFSKDAVDRAGIGNLVILVTEKGQAS